MKTIATLGARAGIVGALATWIVLALIPLPRLEPLPPDAPLQDFSAMRAMVHIAAIAERPHPLGSPEHDRVRDYILTEITKQGVAPEIQAGVAEFRWRSKSGSARVENVLARLPGSANTRAVMLSAHYDSVPDGPGAADDGHGIGVLLETMRALRSGPPLRNDVIFFFSDGEEPGSLGAQVFLRDQRWRSEPGVVLNFEAGGAGGPATILQTSPGNDWLMQQVRAALPSARGSSMASEIFRRMPNNDDLTIFRRSGLAGLDFAFAGHGEVYHTAGDDVDHLDRRSVQEQGQYALSLTRWFGGLDLAKTQSSQDAVFFSMRPLNLVVYSSSWVMPLALISGAGLMIGLWFGWQRRSRGLWIGAPLSLLWLLALLSIKAPAVSYLIQLPMIGAAAGFIALMTAPETLTFGWRLGVMMISPAPAFLVLFYILRPVYVGLASRPDASGPRAAALPFLVSGSLLVVAMILPQLVLLCRRKPGQ